MLLLAIASLTCTPLDVAPKAASAKRATPVEAEYGTYSPQLVTRAMWQAKAPLPGMLPQEPLGIILHHSGTRRNTGLALEPKLRNLQSFSQRPVHRAAGRTDASWPDVPYHFYIDGNARIGEGRDVRFAGDTNTGYDTKGYIQIAIEGDFETEQPTPQQIEAVRDLLVWLMLSWQITEERISTHKDHAPTDCPGKNLLAVLPNAMRSVRERYGSARADLCRRSGSNPEFAQLYCNGR